MNEREEGTELTALRSEIESEHRFRTSILGYDKASVKSYVEELQREQQSFTQEMASQLEVMRSEKDSLNSRIVELEEQLATAREEERARLAAESSVREGALAALRAENAQLVEENRQRQMQITELEERMSALGEGMMASAGELEALYDTLGSLLNGKLNDCNQLLEAARKEHAVALSAARDKISAA